MALKSQTGNTPKLVTREITISEPLDGSGFKKHRVLFTFAIVPKSDTKNLGDDELLALVVKGWGDDKRGGKGGIESEDGTPVPFSEEELARQCETPWIASGIVRAYFDIAYGGKLGN